MEGDDDTLLADAADAADAAGGSESGDGDDDDLRRLLADVAAAPSQAPPAVAGDRVGRYVLIRRLGAGGMGVVFAAYDPQLDRRVAIKLLRRDVLGTAGSSRARERTVREARALARLIHPHIVAVHDAGFHKGELYIVMELIDGQSLGDWLEARARPVAELCDVFRQAALGLAAAHAQQMVHRDFKPDNVLIGRDNRVRVADFGLVHIADSTQGSDDGRLPPEAAAALQAALGEAGTPPLTMTGAFLGTPAYMAPEQLAGADVDARADQFAFGVALWAALYGAPPWPPAELPARRQQLAAGPPAEPAQAHHVPRWLRALVRRALAPSADDRFPSMTALVAALDRGRAGRRRLTTALAAGGLVALTGGALAFAAAREPGPEVCGGGAALVAASWGPARAAEAQVALAGRGVAAGDVAPLVGRLDGYAREWAAEHRAACRATRVDRAQSEEVLDRRMACLDRARASLAAVAGALADGRLDDPRRRAIAHALPPIAACSRRETLDGVEARPTAVDQRALEDAIGLTLDARLAVDEVARPDAVKVSERALAAAQATGWAPLVADAAFVHGRMLSLRHRFDEARPLLDLSLREALRGSHPAAQAEIMAGLAYLELMREHPEEAQAWIDRALAIVDRLRGEREVSLAVLDDAVAIALAAGDLVRARGFVDRSVALADQPGGDRRVLADALLDLGKLHAAEGRHAEALATLDRAIALASEALGADSPWLATALEATIEPLIALGRTADARAAVERAIAVRAPVYGPDDPVAGELYTVLGAIAHRHGDLETAREVMVGAVPRAIATYGADTPGVAMAIANLAMLDAEAGDHARAEAGAVEAQRIFEARGGADAPELLNVLVLRAYAARGQDRLADARRHLERARAIALRHRGADHPETANILVELAHTERLAGRLADAAAGYQALVGREDLPPPLLAEAAFGLAQAEWARGRRAPARDAAARAVSTYQALGDDFAGKRAEVEAWLSAHPAP